MGLGAALVATGPSSNSTLLPSTIYAITRRHGGLRWVERGRGVRRRVPVAGLVAPYLHPGRTGSYDIKAVRTRLMGVHQIRVLSLNRADVRSRAWNGCEYSTDALDRPQSQGVEP